MLKEADDFSIQTPHPVKPRVYMKKGIKTYAFGGVEEVIRNQSSLFQDV